MFSAPQQHEDDRSNSLRKLYADLMNFVDINNPELTDSNDDWAHKPENIRFYGHRNSFTKLNLCNFEDLNKPAKQGDASIGIRFAYRRKQF